jgi:hypothetical protein
LRFSGLRVERPGYEQRERCGCPRRSTSLVLGRHYRALPQRLVASPRPFGLDALSGSTSMRGKVTERFVAPTASGSRGFARRLRSGLRRLTEVRCRSRLRGGFGRLLPWGSVPFGVSTWAIVASVCLFDAIRSQRFSRSQRFEPARVSWPCFMPHPPLGFRNGLQSLSRSTSRDASRRPLPSCRSLRFALARRWPTSGRCSGRASVLGCVRLSAQPSRCSLDLHPLRGVPIQSLGRSPPLMCLLRRRWLRPKTLLRATSRHFRVSPTEPGSHSVDWLQPP